MAFNKEDKTSYDELAPSLQEIIDNKVDQQVFDRHVENFVNHIINDERVYWNSIEGTCKKYADNIRDMLENKKLNISDFNNYWAGLQNVAFTGSYNSLSDKPTVIERALYADNCGSIGGQSVGNIISSATSSVSSTQIAVGYNNLSFTSNGNFKYLIVTVNSRFEQQDGQHNISASHDTYANGSYLGRLTLSDYVIKTGDRGHYWGYPVYSTAMAEYSVNLTPGSNISISYAGGQCHHHSYIMAFLQ